MRKAITLVEVLIIIFIITILIALLLALLLPAINAARHAARRNHIRQDLRIPQSQDAEWVSMAYNEAMEKDIDPKRHIQTIMQQRNSDKVIEEQKPIRAGKVYSVTIEGHIYEIIIYEPGDADIRSLSR